MQWHKGTSLRRPHLPNGLTPFSHVHLETWNPSPLSNLSNMNIFYGWSYCPACRVLIDMTHLLWLTLDICHQTCRCHYKLCNNHLTVVVQMLFKSQICIGKYNFGSNDFPNDFCVYKDLQKNTMTMCGNESDPNTAKKQPNIFYMQMVKIATGVPGPRNLVFSLSTIPCLFPFHQATYIKTFCKR